MKLYFHRLRAVSFFISPSNKTRENSYARDRRRETGKELKKKYRLLAVYISK